MIVWQTFFAMFPDLVWTPATAYWLITTSHLRFSTPLYDVSHSLVVFVVMVGAVTFFYHRAYLLMWPWALHIFVDVPGHLGDIRTPILWPLSRFTFPGWWNWETMTWVIINYCLLVVALIVIWWRKRSVTMRATPAKNP